MSRWTGRARPGSVAIVAGVCYAGAFFAWAGANGVHYPSGDLASLAVGLAYGGLGLFLLASVPVYLLGRSSLLTPLLVAGWSAVNVVYLHEFGSHMHPISSYLIVWPLFVGLIAVVAILEFAIRTVSVRFVGRFGPKPLF